MAKKILIISDKDLDSPFLTGIELRCLQMKSYFKSIGADVTVWQAKRKAPLSLISLFKGQLPKELQEAVAKNDFVYAAVTSSKQSTIYKLCKKKNHPKIILDLFTPILVEKKATGSVVEEKEVIVGDQILAASHFICATPRQLVYCKEVIKMVTNCNSQNISIVPFIPPKVSNQTISEEGGTLPALDEKKQKIFWVGAFYPWFDHEKLTQLILQIDSDHKLFVIIGGKNPKTHAYDSNYEKIYQWSVTHKLLNKKILFIDWLPYQQFHDFLRRGDLAILFVKNSEEDHLAVRSRLLSCYIAGLPVVTNGQDELTSLAKQFELSYEYSETNPKNSVHELVELALKKKPGNKWPQLRKAIEMWTRDENLKKLIND